MKAWVGCLAWLLALSSAGCSSGGDSGGANGQSCGAFSACGGDLTGTWKLTNACVTGVGHGTSCPEMTIEPHATLTGTVTFDASGAYSADITASGSAVVTIPQSCLNGMTCAQAQSSLTQDPSIQSGTCSGSSSCTCNVTYTPQHTQVSGTYTTSGNTVTITPSGQSPRSSEYCVKGTSLELQHDNSDGTVATNVAQKQ